eukprot:GHVR01132519.1.p1 GENE.GHVR01132519.1~~GHVR01132519.1.p1  ORF type:complete len:132 (+),score=43.04 GHVR01132519.1:110-505(+)
MSGHGKNPLIERVNNVWGSCAGAGSDFFHLYNNTRRNEMERLKKMDEDWEVKVEADEFETRRLQRKELVDNKTLKNSLKRKKKKEAKKRYFDQIKDNKRADEALAQFAEGAPSIPLSSNVKVQKGPSPFED